MERMKEDDEGQRRLQIMTRMSTSYIDVPFWRTRNNFVIVNEKLQKLQQQNQIIIAQIIL